MANTQKAIEPKGIRQTQKGNLFPAQKNYVAPALREYGSVSAMKPPTKKQKVPLD